MQKTIALSLLLLLLLTSHANAQSGGLGTSPGPSPVTRAKIKNGFAIPPVHAPKAVKKAIRAGNKIAKKPYAWAGGHSLWRGGILSYIRGERGFDCSGSVSFLLGSFGGGWLLRPKNSSSFMNWGERGKGRWFTVYASSGHAYLLIAGLRFDTSGLDERGTRWSRDLRGIRGLTPRRLAAG